jgi:hypothetical protein
MYFGQQTLLIDFVVRTAVTKKKTGFRSLTSAEATALNGFATIKHIRSRYFRLRPVILLSWITLLGLPVRIRTLTISSGFTTHRQTTRRVLLSYGKLTCGTGS